LFRHFRILFIFCAAWPAAAGVDLESRAWRVTLDPSTLAVSARPAGGRDILISAGQAGLGEVADLVRDGTSLRWKLPSKALAVSAAVRDNQFTIRFTTDHAGRLTWPVYGSPDATASYIIPHGEGLLVSPRAAAWERRFSTMEGFSLPLWGVLGKGWTLTYLMANPFDNTFVFRDTEAGLSWQLEHEFQRNWAVKECGFDIVLGPESPIEPAREYRRRLIASGGFVSMKQKIARTPEAAKLPGAPHAYVWEMSVIERLQAKGFDRFWLGVSSLAQMRGRPEAAHAARKAGFLLGPYDSYDSIHSPDEKDTWETAQFDRELFEKGAVIGPNGKKLAGFKKKGYWLSSLAARPYVERRVGRTFADFAFNSFFMDCDATGFLHDNYSALFPATQADDMRERLRRMQWVVDRYGVPIGSEDGKWFAAPVIHFGHGMMTPVFGFFDARFRDRTSPYFLGGWWPPAAPAVFLKPVPVPEDYRAMYFDPRSRIPLFQTVYHDSVVTTHHWSRASLKFSNVAHITELLELLYNVPPLYHLNLAELEKRADLLLRHYRFFSPLHRETALLPMTGFAWLTPDRLVQRTTFGGAIEMTANFRPEPFSEGALRVPAFAVAARHLDSGRVEVFLSPPPR
jgi:hypothetical protein